MNENDVRIDRRSLDLIATEGGTYLTVLGRWSKPGWADRKAIAAADVQNYLYSGAVVSTIAVDDVDRVAVIVVVPTMLAKDTAARLQTGLFGVTEHTSYLTASDYVALVLI